MTNIRQENPIPINQQLHKRMERKRKTRRVCRFPNIPEEIIVEILSRLSLSSLSRFTCVSKQWRSLVSDIIPTKTGRKMVLVHSVLGSGTAMFHSINEESHVKQVGRPWGKGISSRSLLVFGSCNGLVLLNIEDDLFLWNPVTWYFKKVLSHNLLADDDYHVVSGLCYDSLSSEYKALVALAPHPERPYYGPYGEFVMVGSFRSKDWRTVPFPWIGTVESGPVVNGNLHWYVSKGYSSRFFSSHQIVYFNPHTNKFNEVPMPEPRPGVDGNMVLGLGVLDGCLSMVHHDNPRSSEANSVEVLVMKEYGMQKSWSMLFIISNLTLTSYDKLVPLCCTKYGEVLMKLCTTGGQNVRAYNLVDSSYKEILVHPNCRSVNAIVYEESLVTPTD